MTQTQTFDAAIVGGGMVGLTTALALESAGLTCALIDAAPLRDLADDAFDGRASAIAYASWRMFDVLGVGEPLRAKAQRIEQILVSDGRAPDGLRRGGAGPFFLRFDHAEINDEGGEPLGYMAENRHMRSAFTEAVQTNKRIEVHAPARVTDMNRNSQNIIFSLSTGDRIQASLAVAADGRNSLLRRLAGIRAHGWPYRQTAVVATARLERDHDGVAHEYFLPSGPFAMLPLPDRRYSLVWTERPRAANALMTLDDDGFAEEMRRRFGDVVGRVTPEGPRWSYPLGLQVAERYHDERLVLVGDAAHAIHPIAGQGFNLGLRDAAVLADILGEARRAGLDIGAPSGLARYEQWRKFDNSSLGAATDAFTRLFSNDHAPIRLARGLGMEMTGRFGPARRFFARHAGGDIGDKPRLLQGLTP